MQYRLQNLEDKKYAELAQQSNDEAVKIVSEVRFRFVFVKYIWKVCTLIRRHFI